MRVPDPVPFFRTRLLTAERPIRYLALCLALDLPVTAGMNILSGAGSPSFTGHSLWGVFLVMCVAVAFIETMVLVAVIEVLRLAVRAPGWVALLAAVIAGGLHSLAVPGWGAIIGWAFFLQALCYLTWQSRSWIAGVAMTCALHGAHNLLPTLLLALERSRATP